ncbi:MAG: hypothetical protein N2Z75_10135, partial [Meiothermus sp.]|nr:hypothetical protein [Meiothermus sp.]
MYEFLLTLHNLARWLVLLAAVWLVYQIVSGLRGRTYGSADRRAGLLYTGLMDLQLVLGILLLVSSPLVQSALGNLG